MNNFLQVAIGGALGSMARYGVNILAGRVTALPLGTLIVNLTGCFAMGLLAAALAFRGGQHLAPLLLTGVLGGFTTFSAFSLDTLALWERGATGLALACDIRLAVPGGKVFYPVMRLGYVPPAPDTGRLIALIGPARAKMILLGGQRVPVEEARDWGLIDRIVAPEALDAEIDALTVDARGATAAHVAALKALFRG